MSNIESFYPLTPMQQGMLFHTLYAPDERVYFKQMACVIEGQLDPRAFRLAWQNAMDRHEVLRTALSWEGLTEPMQQVHAQVVLPWQAEDWSTLAADERNQRLTTFLRADRECDFDLLRAPLMRCALFRTGPESHRFVWSFHHILLDGWSVSLLLKEISADYDAICCGKRVRFKKPRPFREHIAWLQLQDKSAAERFWRQYLRGFPAPTSLTIANTKPTSNRPAYEEHQRAIPSKLAAALQAFARQHGLTLNTVIQGAWALLLSRYSGDCDIVFGATVAGRPAELAGVEQMVGLFINSLPVRVNVDVGAQLVPWLEELQSEQLDSRQYEFSPLVEIQRWSELPPGEALFGSLLVFENYPESEILQGASGPLALHSLTFYERTNYPLTATVTLGKILSWMVLYDSRIYTGDAITRMTDHFLTLLKGMVAQPQRTLGSLELLTPAEQEQLAKWNDTNVRRENVCVHDLLELQVERTPERLAVAFDGQQLTYLQLNEKANRLAHLLLALGVGPEVKVGVCIERSLAMVTSLLAVLKAGGAYVPFDPRDPAERLASMLADASAPVLLTQQHLLERMPFLGAQVVCVDTEWDRIAEQSAANPATGASTGNLAYMIFTSGSTGRPKGVEIEHRGLVNLVHWHQQAYNVTPQDRATQVASPSFDASVWELWPYLTTGASIHIPTEEIIAAPTKLLSWLNTEKITLTFLPTPLAEAVLAEPIPEGLVLRALLTGGDRLNQRPRRALPFRLMNHYGPTENTVVATWGEVVTGTDDSAPHIGRPISNTQIYVLDQSLNPVPVRVRGEIYIGGDTLARGYHNRPELMAQKFVVNPFSHQPGARLYRSGDLARYLPDGNIEFLGRLDDQLKIRGFRIEPGEIEAVLRQHPTVHDTLVTADENGAGGRRLVAYVVAANPDLSVNELRGYLRTKLPQYMVPTAFVTLDALPLTRHGKVDRRALPSPGPAAGDLEEPYIAPRNEMEGRLAGIWGEVLKVERVGIRDNFFDLGGHSLLAARTVSRTAEAFQVELPVSSLFEMPTVEQFAAGIEQAKAQRGQTRPSPIVAVSRESFRAKQVKATAVAESAATE